jgi:hypothetical protein
LKGNHWIINNITSKPKKLFVELLSTRAKVPRIGGEGQFVSALIVEKMLELYQKKDIDIILKLLDATLNPLAKACIKDGLKTFEKELKSKRIVEDGVGGSIIFPWKGPKITNTLFLALRLKGFWVVNANPAILAPDSEPELLKKAIKELLKEKINFNELARIAGKSEFEKYDWMFTPYYKRLNYRTAFLCREDEFKDSLEELIV